MGATVVACGMADAKRLGEKLPRFGGEKPLGLGGGAFLAGAALIGVWASHSPDGPHFGLWGNVDAAVVGSAGAIVLLALRRLPNRDWMPARWSGLRRSWSKRSCAILVPGAAFPPATRPCDPEKGLLVRLGEHGGGDKGGEKGCDDYTHKLDAREHYGSPMLSPVDGCRRDNLMAAAATVLWDLVAVRFSFSGFSTALRTISTVF